MEQYISGLKKKREGKKVMPSVAKGGKLSKKGQVYKNNLLKDDYTAGMSARRRIV